jgi:hypothetical protein
VEPKDKKSEMYRMWDLSAGYHWVADDKEMLFSILSNVVPKEAHLLASLQLCRRRKTFIQSCRERRRTERAGIAANLPRHRELSSLDDDRGRTQRI